MAVYERTYRPYTGELTPERGRFLVLPRYAFADVFRSRLFVAFLVACCIWPVALALMIYLPHNASFLRRLELNPEDVLAFFKFDASFFFKWVMIWQGTLAFFMAFTVGPALVSADLRNNGLPLYLSRPFSRFEYILGKLSVLLILMSAITWVPGLALFLFRSYLAGGAWFAEHYSIGISIVLAFWIWILVLSTISLAISAYVRWKPLARGALFAVFIVAIGLAGVINGIFGTSWGSLINITDMVAVVAADLFGVEVEVAVPLWAAWASLITFCALALLLLARRVKAYDVVR